MKLSLFLLPSRRAPAAARCRVLVPSPGDAAPCSVLARTRHLGPQLRTVPPNSFNRFTSPNGVSDRGWPARYTAADALEIHLASGPAPPLRSPGVFFEQAPFPQPGGMGKGKGTEEKCPQALKPHSPPPSKIIILAVTHMHPSTCAPTYGCGPTAPRGWPGGAEACKELVAHKVPRPGVDWEQREKEEITSVV